MTCQCESLSPVKWFARGFLLTIILVARSPLVGCSNQQCRQIRKNFPLCAEVRYNMTTFPNFLQHRNFDEASLELVQFKPLVEVNCSPYLRFFLCTIYVPICQEGIGKVPPCRSLCEAAKKNCATLMQQFGFEWPQNMRCERYPPDNALCIPLNVTQVDGGGGEKTKPTNVPPQTKDPLRPLNTSRYKCEGPQRKEDDAHYVFMKRASCAAKCEPVYFEVQQHDFARTWILFWSIVCVISTTFTLLTFLVDMTRFRYPERPIIFLSGCYLVIAVVFIVGSVIGDKVVCHASRVSGVRLLNQGTEHAACTVSFMFVYFFLMSASIWWLVLTLTWFLAAGLKWGHEAIEASSQYFHAAAWAVPAAKTIAILAMNAIDGDLLSGVCFVGGTSLRALRGFVLAPLFAYLLIGIFFLLSGFINLVRIRSVLKSEPGLGGPLRTDKLTKLMLRIGVFSVLYVLPAIIVIACLFYEQHFREHWDNSWIRLWVWTNALKECDGMTASSSLSTCRKVILSAGPPALRLTKPDFAVFMIKYLMLLMVGITSGFWIWSGKTLSSWKRFYSTKLMARRGAGNRGRLVMPPPAINEFRGAASSHQLPPPHHGSQNGSLANTQLTMGGTMTTNMMH